MRFVGQHHQPRGTAQPLHRGEHALALDRERAGVVVVHAMDEEDRVLDLVGVVERRHLLVDVLRLPVVALFGLEAERGQRAVVGAAARDAGLEQAGMREQVGGHERTVGVATDRDVLAVGHATPHHFIHGRLGIGDQLRQVGVVRLLVALTDDRHRRADQHRVALGQERLRTPVADRVEAVRRIGDLAGGFGGLELPRVGPHQQRQRTVLLRVVTRRQHQRGGQVDAVVALVADLLLAHPTQLRQRVLEVGQRLRCSRGITQRLHVEVGRLIGRFTGQQQRGAFLVEQRHRRGIGRGLRVEQARGLLAVQIEAVHERTIAFRRSTQPVQEDAAAIGTHLQARAPVDVAHQARATGIVVAVLRGTCGQQFSCLLRLVGRDPPLLDLAVLPPRFVEQRQITTAPLDAGIAAAQLRQGHRRLVEGGGLHQHGIAHLGLAVRVAAILRLGPDQGRRGIGAPVDPAHAGGHRIVAGRQAFLQRQVGYGVLQLAVHGGQHFDATRECAGRHQIGIRTHHPFTEQVTAIRGERDVPVHPARGERRGHAVERDLGRLRAGVIIEEAGIGLVLEHVLVGADGAHTGVGLGLLDRRAGRNAAGGRCRPLALELLHHQQAPAVGLPAVAIAHHRVQIADQAPRRTGVHINDPQFIGVGGRMHLVEGDVLLVRRPRKGGDRQRLRQPADLAFLAIGHVHQPQLVGEAEAAGRMRGRVDAQAGQLQFGLGDVVDRRQRRGLQQRGQVTARGQAQGRGTRRVDHRLQRRRGQLIAARVTLGGGHGLRGGLRGRRGGQRQRRHRQQGQAEDQGMAPLRCASTMVACHVPSLC